MTMLGYPLGRREDIFPIHAEPPGGVGVEEYRIFTLDKGGRVIAASRTDQSSDEAARLFVREILLEGETAEIWSAARYVGQVTGPLPPSDTKQAAKKLA
jgi:hypothetical protein